jgi:hypothetical protein
VYLIAPRLAYQHPRTCCTTPSMKHTYFFMIVAALSIALYRPVPRLSAPRFMQRMERSWRITRNFTGCSICTLIMACLILEDLQRTAPEPQRIDLAIGLHQTAYSTITTKRTQVKCNTEAYITLKFFTVHRSCAFRR